MSTMPDTRTTNPTLLRLAVAMSGLSLLLSGWAFVSSLGDDDIERRTDERLTCLELPGPNDCGQDGR